MISKKDICVKCNLEYDPIRWSTCTKRCAAKGKTLNAYGGGYFVCDNCFDDKVRHKIIENFLGYDNDIIDTEKFNQLLYFMNLSNRFEFYNWFMREASQYCLYDLSLYRQLKTTSAYSIPIKNLINFICKTYGSEFQEHVNSGLGSYIHTEKQLIMSNIPRPCKY